MTVLVAYGSKREGTEGLATMVGDALRQEGFTTEVRPARSVRTRDIPPVRGVAALIRRVGARGHATFGGRLEPGAKGFPASAMAKKSSGDWRDPIMSGRGSAPSPPSSAIGRPGT